MKKKQRCLLKRFAALVAALVICLALSVPAFAASNEASMPSITDFIAHPDSFYVWRSPHNLPYHYELIASPIILDSDGFAASGSTTYTYSNVLKSFDYPLGDESHSVFGCAIPLPILFPYSTLDNLPSFRVDSSSNWYSSRLHFYPSSGQDLSDVYCYLAPLACSLDRSLVSFPASTASFDAAFFDSPFLAFPFATRSYSSTNRSGFHRLGGTPLFGSYTSDSSLTLNGSYYFTGTSTLSPYPSGYTVPTSDLGVVFVKQPSGTYITDVSYYSVSVKGCFSFFVPKLLLSGVQPGDWLSASDFEKLQDTLVNEFDVDSDTLTNSKDNLNSWNSTSSVDSDVASGAIGLLNGIFQNLGTFLFSVSLLCFGAVVLRMLIRKAVDG